MNGSRRVEEREEDPIAYNLDRGNTQDNEGERITGGRLGG